MSCLLDRWQTLQQRFSAADLKRFIEGIYGSDHWPSFKSFHKTAHWIADTLNAYDRVSARVIEFPADGETMYGDWVMPCAWDAHAATLKDLGTEEVLIDYQDVPTAMVMGAGATPAGGVRAELIYIEKAADLKDIDVSGKIALTGFMPHAIKKEFVAAGGQALLFAPKIADDMDDAVRWVNSWSDDPALWSATKADTPCPALSLSVNQAVALQKRLANGETIELELVVETETYDGTLPVVEALIHGETEDEVFITGHLYEQGANDNASGGASMMEIARMFGSGPQPKRGLRFLFTSEIYGTIPYCDEHRDEIRKCIAGIDIDSTAEPGRNSGKMDIIENPLCNPSFVNVLMKEVIAAAGVEEAFAWQKYLLDDNLVADPQIGIPCVLVGVCSKNWHTSFDTLDIIDWDLFHLTTCVCAAWVDTVANGGEAEATALRPALESCITDLQADLDQRELDDAAAVYKEQYLNEVASQMRASLNKLHPVCEVAGEAHGEENGPERVYFGTPSFSQMSAAERSRIGLNMWSSNSYFPIFYANGQRSNERIAAYMHFSFKVPPERVVKTLESLREADYLR